jgi:hypothetical protein
MAPSPLRPWPNVLASGSDRSLLRRFERGELVRLQPGYYVERARWEQTSASERFLACATAKHHHGGAVFCGESALLLLGLPTFGPPSELTLAVRSPSRVGSGPSTLTAASGTLASAGYRYPLPVVRRHLHSSSASVQAGDFDVLEPLACLLEVLERAPLVRSLVLTDALARARVTGHGIPGLAQDEILASARALPSGVRRERALLAIASARAGAESPGESVSRAIFLDAGLQAPELQSEHWDERGLVGYSDFCWPGVWVIGEFDGRVKYNGSLGAPGTSTEQAIWAEKQRENRLTRLGFRVIRWTWADLFEPQRLIRTLRAAGVPLATRAAA